MNWHVVEGTITGTGRRNGRDIVFLNRLDGTRLRGSLPKNLKAAARIGDVVKFRVEVLHDHQDGEWLWPSSGEVLHA
jgi:hypothetical protein